LSEKGDQRRTIWVGTTIAKAKITDTGSNYTKGTINVTRSFHDKIYIVSMGMNAKVQGRPPLLQCITLHSLLVFEEIEVLKIYLVKHQKSMTRENARVHTDYGRHRFNPSGHLRNIYHELQE
jgi:hypothetical protein